MEQHQLNNSTPKKKKMLVSRIRRLLVYFFFIGTLVKVAVGCYHMQKEYVMAREAFEFAKSQNEKVIAKQRRIVKDYQRLQDPDYVAGLARRDYYYSKPGEMIFELGEATQETLNPYGEE